MYSLTRSRLLFLLMMVVMVTSSQLKNNHRMERDLRQNKDCKCGKRNSNRRIVGGQETEVNEWPWMVALVNKTVLDETYLICGASLINDRYLLTAAHCLEHRMNEKENIRIHLAEHDLQDSKETELVTRDVKDMLMHPKYGSNTEYERFQNDIALIKLSEPVKMSTTVLPVCLPPRDGAYVGESVVVTGWGEMNPQTPRESSDKLREVSLNVVENTECQKSNTQKITPEMLCAAAPGKDSCWGDSGGPLVYKDKDGYYDEIGVVSFGRGCAQPNITGVYARVSSFLDWIAENTKDAIYCE